MCVNWTTASKEKFFIRRFEISSGPGDLFVGSVFVMLVTSLGLMSSFLRRGGV